MNPALWIAKTGLEAQQTRLGVISNNLANANNAGFKKDRALFADLLFQNIRQSGASSTQDTQLPTGLNLGTGVRTVATQKIHTQGNIQQTENALDVAIQGDGFLQVLRPDGTQAYTRNGALQVDSTGQLVTANGESIQPAITIPQDATSITIGSDGTVSVQQSGTAAATQVGNIQLASFINAAGLQPLGDNLFSETGSSGAAQTGNPGLNGLGSLLQGSLESSNVNVVEELVNMIETQRVYEMNSRSISTADQMLQYVSNNL
ncbi:flagellar basal-body rod protein FlgG [Sulfuriflexus sp.]|uniref:flagellar basal-body rod protein FlgG n=1 Tax=Sulfuriflexus sp. TaxID=2015443 RepID=UPI0028CFCD44|nr:flagellar basal-body rod protein FlgG [Sulfuriflexus sp.]MDT8404487.1 flagellar basal-body rod protein FlgG [Sulfuriflexus sp.]